MDIAQQLSQKHHHLFDPLIAAYQKSKPDGRVRQRQGEMIVELLGFTGDVIQIHINGYEPLHIATHYGVTEDEVNNILANFNQRNITSFNIQKVIYKSEVNQLREKLVIYLILLLIYALVRLELIQINTMRSRGCLET